MNNISKNRTHSKKRGYKINYGKIILLFSVLFFFIIIGNNIVKASDSEYTPKNKIYTSISIKKGDTLWDIANEYAQSNISVNQYINEIVKINNLPSTDITSGQKLIVFYYE